MSITAEQEARLRALAAKLAEPVKATADDPTYDDGREAERIAASEAILEILDGD